LKKGAGNVWFAVYFATLEVLEKWGYPRNGVAGITISVLL